MFKRTIIAGRPFSFNDVDAITLIENIEDIKGYELHDFQDFLNDVKENKMKCNLDSELLFNGSLGDAAILENNEDYDTL